MQARTPTHVIKNLDKHEVLSDLEFNGQDRTQFLILIVRNFTTAERNTCSKFLSLYDDAAQPADSAPPF